MNKIELYIGSSNETQKINDVYLNKITKWANTVFPQGYTLFKGKGYWQNTTEDSILLISICLSELTLKEEIEKLKIQLNQKSILVIKTEIGERIGIVLEDLNEMMLTEIDNIEMSEIKEI